MDRATPLNTHNAISGFMVFIIITVFFAMSFVLALLSTQAYRNVISSADKSSNERVYCNYFQNRFRAVTNTKNIVVKKNQNRDIIYIYDDIDTGIYMTRVYCYNGWLYEHFATRSKPFNLGMGEKLCEAENISASINNKLIEIIVTAQNGREYYTYTALGVRER